MRIECSSFVLNPIQNDLANLREPRYPESHKKIIAGTLSAVCRTVSPRCLRGFGSPSLPQRRRPCGSYCKNNWLEPDFQLPAPPTLGSSIPPRWWPPGLAVLVSSTDRSLRGVLGLCADRRFGPDPRHHRHCAAVFDAQFRRWYHAQENRGSADRIDRISTFQFLGFRATGFQPVCFS